MGRGKAPLVMLLQFLLFHPIFSLPEDSSTCLMLYKEGGAPAVFQSPKCPRWTLLDDRRSVRTSNCQSAMLQGRRSSQEDRMLCVLDMRIPFPGRTGIKEVSVGIVAVFDGHNGAEASEMASKLLLEYFLLHAYFLLDGIFSVTFKKSYGKFMSKGDMDAIFEVVNRHNEKLQRNLNFERSNGLVPFIFDESLHMEILKESLLRTIHDIDITFSKEAYEKSLESGSTATIVLIADSQILVANIGDSKALLCSEDFYSTGSLSKYNRRGRGRRRNKAVSLTTNAHDNFIKLPSFDGSTYFCVKELTSDHHPDRDDERARVEAAGGYVAEWGGIARVNGELAISRAIGDLPYKSYGVISVPEVTDWQPFTVNDTYLVVASDGVFEKMSTQDICDLLWEADKQKSKDLEVLSTDLWSLADYIVNTAFKEGSMDNMAAVVVSLRPTSISLSSLKGLSDKYVEADFSSGPKVLLGAEEDLRAVGRTTGPSSNLVPVGYFNQIAMKLKNLLVEREFKKIGCFYLSENLNEDVDYIFKSLRDDKKNEVPVMQHMLPESLGQCHLDEKLKDLYIEENLCQLGNDIRDDKEQCINPDGLATFLGLLESIPLNYSVSSASRLFGHGPSDFRYVLKRKFDRGSYGEVWLAFSWNCSQDSDSFLEMRRSASSENNFCLDPHISNTSTESNSTNYDGFTNPATDDLFILKRIMVERGHSAYLSGLREKYFGEIFLNASLSLKGSKSSELSSPNMGHKKGSPVDGVRDKWNSTGESANQKVIDGDSDQGLMHIARFIESFESQAKEIWLVFRNEGLSLSKLIYTAEETRATSRKGGDSARNVQVLHPSKWWHWLRTTEAGRYEMRNIMWQLLLALKACHDRNITHRDIKPENMVICFEDLKTGRCLREIPSGEANYHIKMRIIDFGSAIDLFTMKNLYGSNGPSRSEQTFEYGPPEALLNSSWFQGPTSTTLKYDMWSVGVVMLELILGSPHVFEISSRTQALLDQYLEGWNQGTKTLAYKLRSLMEMCILSPGSSPQHNRRDGTKDHLGVWPASWKCSEESFSKLVKLRDPLRLGFPNIWALRLVRQLLLWHPEDRLSVDEALQHPYFYSQLQT
ncbi:hypothetical protein H6P81_004741 [Aristolochia fimbriata]|uniref:Protein-serine/threonine phosphatase n=1 Tax=Aristolochia fimbriata TaxID=158543 RepID=A0AAV7ESL1_ARIFI|nr:hypothetical protein H6P81_004741 [Aristolochia fimbriata]